MFTARDVKLYGTKAVSSKYPEGPKKQMCLNCDDEFLSTSRDHRICRKCMVNLDAIEGNDDVYNHSDYSNRSRLSHKVSS